MKYKIDLNDFCEDVFHEMERLSEGLHGHEFIIEAQNKTEATILTSEKLMPFLRNKLEQQDNWS